MLKNLFGVNSSFLTNKEKFSYLSGTLPIILTSPHGYSDGSQREVDLHLCDFAVSPFLQILKESTPHKYYIIENQTHRSHIDMNRIASRLNDDIDHNDYMFRQFIRFICDVVSLNYHKTPLLFDLHSYANHLDWNPYDLMLLIQTKKGMKTNPSLLNRTVSFFNEKGWKIGQTMEHNQDDIVEDVTEDQYAHSLLIEINEDLLSDNKAFSKLVKDFDEFLLFMNEQNFEFNKISSDGKNVYYEFFNSTILPETSLSNHLTLIKNSSDSAFKQKYLMKLNHVFSLLKSTPSQLMVNTDSNLSDFQGYRSISELYQNLPHFSDSGLNESEVIERLLITVSNSLNSLIIPLEIVLELFKNTYKYINRRFFQEWDVHTRLFIENLFYVFPSKRDMGIVFIKWKSNPKLPYISYNLELENTERFWVSHLILCKNNSNLSDISLKKDLSYLKEIFAYPFDDLSIENLITYYQSQILKSP